MKIAVIGAGYVGLATAVLMLQNKQNSIYLVEKDKKRRDMLTAEHPVLPITEDGLNEAYLKAWNEGRIEVSNSLYGRDYDFIFVCVGTPSDENGGLLNTTDVINTIHFFEYQQECPIIIKSTVNIGDTRELYEAEISADLVFSPEFLREGTAFKDSKNPDRIIIGTEHEDTYKKILALYKGVLTGAAFKRCKFLKMSPTAAEIVKLASNAYLALRLTFFNELSMVCDIEGADIKDVIAGVTSDNRIGDKYSSPSIGYAGPCLPKDSKALVANEPVMNTVKAASKSNDLLFEFYVEKIQKLIDENNLNSVLFLGLAFKSYSDDIRNSKIVDLKNRLKVNGAISVYDPRSGFDLELNKSYDLILLASEEYAKLINNIDYKIVFDLKSILPKDSNALYVGKV